mmetsp:Transcript_40464/g.53065  ORF Transcript_40464/g.53065 Transcript_40464/m.53065 type:complete len:286 (+) Transcript_40464:533-1390(+)|eukprot:CAMPEP_0185575016 /NCGR_PEP_ID=MMETSP0434-20130131/6324_1 /TAXON_ID=626734 ORGANISM="Favella taraikaensis, Strain Fe Narragansett Bay" /NCGR_SAMPLE_ID=MMETSP0434 /ASSEMBLY_ACC=CAM_ASM_000379 /LENGTH=285 /DNA_ID=CAMNT_0028191773 /DNA_START=530 /DNA_END=1387 /DNA_ORIENTATION=+
MSCDNTMWANTVLASQHLILGLVVYTGRETRSQMNQRVAQNKTCLLDEEVNFLSKLLFIFLLSVSLLLTALNGFHGHWLMFYFRVMLLLSSIIPISVRINLDLAKLWYSHGINSDADIKGTQARNSNIPEELGRIQFLISDKTGTLTQNDMICRKIFLEYSQFSYKDNKGDMLQMLESSCTQNRGIAADYHLNEREGSYVSRRREQNDVLRDFMSALALCNNVTPVQSAPVADFDNFEVEEVNIRDLHQRNSFAQGPNRGSIVEEQQPQLEASSPDEVALVKFGY